MTRWAALPRAPSGPGLAESLCPARGLGRRRAQRQPVRAGQPHHRSSCRRRIRRRRLGAGWRPCSVGIESTIVDCTRAQPVLLRPGQISRDDIAKVLAAQVADRDAQAPKASGTLEAHYAPNAKVVLFDADQRQALLDAGTRHGARLGYIPVRSLRQRQPITARCRARQRRPP